MSKLITLTFPKEDAEEFIDNQSLYDLSQLYIQEQSPEAMNMVSDHIKSSIENIAIRSLTPHQIKKICQSLDFPLKKDFLFQYINKWTSNFYIPVNEQVKLVLKEAKDAGILNDVMTKLFYSARPPRDDYFGRSYSKKYMILARYFTKVYPEQIDIICGLIKFVPSNYMESDFPPILRKALALIKASDQKKYIEMKAFLWRKTDLVIKSLFSNEKSYRKKFLEAISNRIQKALKTPNIHGAISPIKNWMERRIKLPRFSKKKFKELSSKHQFGLLMFGYSIGSYPFSKKEYLTHTEVNKILSPYVFFVPKHIKEVVKWARYCRNEILKKSRAAKLALQAKKNSCQKIP